MRRERVSVWLLPALFVAGMFRLAGWLVWHAVRLLVLVLRWARRTWAEARRVEAERTRSRAAAVAERDAADHAARMAPLTPEDHEWLGRHWDLASRRR